MKSQWILGAVAASAIAIGAAFVSVPCHAQRETAAFVEDAAAVGDVAAADDAPIEVAPRSRTWRLGFWELDFLALDRAPNRTTFRLLDLGILSLLEIGSGEAYHSFRLLDAPGVVQLATFQGDGPTFDRRLLDIQLMALLRSVRESAQQEETHILKMPLMGSLYGWEIDGTRKTRHLLFLGRYDVER